MGLDLGTLTNPLKGIFGDALRLGGGGRLIGLDVGQSSVKVVEAQKSGKGFEVVGFSSRQLLEGTIIGDTIHDKDNLVSAVGEAVRSGGFSTKNVGLNVSGPSVVVKRLKLAGGTREEIEDQIFWESEQYIPFDPEDAYISFYMIGEDEAGGVDVVLTAAERTVVDTMRGVVEEAGLKVKLVSPNYIAVANVFELVRRDRDLGESWLIVNIGGQTTDVVIHSLGGVSFTKEIEFGGLMVTEEIQRQMGVTHKEAEDLKTTTDENGNLPEEVFDIVGGVLESYFMEIKKTIDVYNETVSDKSFSGCYLTGGGVKLPNVQAGFKDFVSGEVQVLDPFKGGVGHGRLKCSDEQLESISLRGVSALGLAMMESA